MNSGATTRYKAHIANQSYTIITNEDQLHMDMVSTLVKEQIEAAQKENPSLTMEQAAVLIAFNTVSSQIKQQQKIISLTKEADDLLEELEQMIELEERIESIEKRQKSLTDKIISEGREPSEEELQRQIEVQKLRNQKVKERIQRSVDYK